MTPEIHNAARQAAREAVAREQVAKGLDANTADLVRAGKFDNNVKVAAALIGADAALAAVLPLVRAAVVRECARIAQDEESRLRGESFKAAEQPEVFPGLARERELQSVTAKEIMLTILSLPGQQAQEDTTR